MSLSNNEDYFIYELEYKVSKEGKTRIFSFDFIENNKNKCQIIYNEQEYELTEYFENIDKNYTRNELIKFQLRINNNITDISYMFDFCETLLSIKDIIELDNSNINGVKESFFEHNNNICSEKSDNSNRTEKCNQFYADNSELSTIPLISFTSGLNTEINKGNNISKNFFFCNVTNMSSMFYGCSSLKSLPDISKWDTTNVTDMSYMFNECSRLISLPDISIWNTQNINNMCSMFYKCSSLISLPDISIWYTSRVIYMYSMFYGCSSLKSLPDISQWNTSKVTDMNSMFYGCSSLKSLPDISIWYTSKVSFMYSMFEGCSSLISLPDISQWNTSKINLMYSMFSGCSSLTSLPDISIWDTSNVTDMKAMFSDCSKDLNIPKKFK